jgi:hydrogenase nickel incorporation protein HypB
MTKVDVGRKVLSANEEYALKNSQIFAKHKKLCLNMISSPGSGKTAIISRTITELRGQLKIGVIEGDIQTDLDAERIRRTGAPAVQIETGGSCHLSAAQVNGALAKLPVSDLDLIIIENVGNLVCPSAFELGEDHKVVVLSVPEGDDKPAKYPTIFARSKVLLINKTDLFEAVGQVDFDMEKVKRDACKLNKGIEIFSVSARSGEGMNRWYEWLKREVKRVRGD